MPARHNERIGDRRPGLKGPGRSPGHLSRPLHPEVGWGLLAPDFVDQVDQHDPHNHRDRVRKPLRGPGQGKQRHQEVGEGRLGDNPQEDAGRGDAELTPGEVDFQLIRDATGCFQARGILIRVELRQARERKLRNDEEGVCCRKRNAADKPQRNL